MHPVSSQAPPTLSLEVLRLILFASSNAATNAYLGERILIFDSNLTQNHLLSRAIHPRSDNAPLAFTDMGKNVRPPEGDGLRLTAMAGADYCFGWRHLLFRFRSYGKHRFPIDQYNPDALYGRCSTGQLRSPGNSDGNGARRISALAGVFAV